VAGQLLFTGCTLLSEKPKAPPTPQEQHPLTIEEAEATIHRLKKKLKEEEKETIEMMSLLLLIFCFQ
jgi:hypothetical protein